MSLENEQVGWSSFWTITPSAINSWVGAELRTIGAEGTLEWRRESGNDVTLIGAVFGCNDPAGVMIADRGWTFDDRVTGLFEHSRLPDASRSSAHRAPPIYAHLFTEIDDRPGWYLDLSWEPDRHRRLRGHALRQRGRSDAYAGGQIAWHTRFWDVGFQKQIGELTLLSQAMSGGTIIEPSPFFHQTTDFRRRLCAGRLRPGRMVGWRRASTCSRRAPHRRASRRRSSEDGHAFTLSVELAAAEMAAPHRGISLGRRHPRRSALVEGDAPHQIETQFQFVWRASISDRSRASVPPQSGDDHAGWPTRNSISRASTTWRWCARTWRAPSISTPTCSACR